MGLRSLQRAVTWYNAPERLVTVVQVTDLGVPRQLQPRLAIPRLGRSRTETMAAPAPRESTTAQGLAWALFALSLIVYALTRLVGLDRFPINLFADEANQVLNAVALVKRGLRSPEGELLPVYIQLFSFYYPDISIYLHALSATIFGISITVARATSALLTLATAAAAALVMKEIFRARNWWAVVLLFATTPAWFLWSRTAFDPIAMASLYGLFLVCYLLYRHRAPHYLFLTVVLGAATFYAYPSGQPAVGLLALFLLVSDWRYHWHQRRMWLGALPLALFAAIPFMRFEIVHPHETLSHLHALNSFWVQNIAYTQKLRHWAWLYAQILSPAYWFLPDQADLMRHSMKGYGFLPIVELPLFVAGVVACLYRMRESKYRTLLAALVTAPVGATVAEPAIIRELAFIVPATIVSAVGLDWILSRIARPSASLLISTVLFVVLGAMSVALLHTALANGPTWYSNYGLYGMQWGAKQLFQEAIPAYLTSHPDRTIYVSHTWANGAEVYPRFFASPARVHMGTINSWLENKRGPGDTVFVMTPEEYETARTSPKLKTVEVEQVVPYPDGRPGFYFAHVAYADNADALIQAEQHALRQRVTETAIINGEPVEISHPRFDVGNIAAMFDGDPFTVARGVAANPLVLDFKFSHPTSINGVAGYFGRAHLRLKFSVYGEEPSNPTIYELEVRHEYASLDYPPAPVVEVAFDRGPSAATQMRMEVSYPESDASAHVHVFDLKFH